MSPDSFNSTFRPAWWLSNGHAQTLWPALFRPMKKTELIEERLELPDGDFVDLCWTRRSCASMHPRHTVHPVHNAPVVVVFHGLEGNINSPYAHGIMRAISNMGWCGVFMHFRGCSHELNRMDRNYHSGDTGDIDFLIKTLRQRHPAVPIFAIGYSLGGNALLKYLGEKNRPDQPDAAAAISIPFLLVSSARKLEHGISRIYQKHLISRLQKKVLKKFGDGHSFIKGKNITALNTFYKFDDQITAPLHGFRDVHDYYEKSSSRQYLKNIKIPTLILHALDDPFMSMDSIPRQDELSDSIQLELSKHGGHVGFVGGKLPWKPIYWLEQRIPRFLAEIY